MFACQCDLLRRVAINCDWIISSKHATISMGIHEIKGHTCFQPATWIMFMPGRRHLKIAQPLPRRPVHA